MSFKRNIDDIFVLHISECAGGVERYIQMLVPRLNSRGVRECFVCSREYDVHKYDGFCDAVEQLDLKRTSNPIFVFGIIRNVRSLIRKFKPDVVYCHSSYAGFFCRFAALGLPCKVVYNPHGWAFNVRSFPKIKRGIFLAIEFLLSFITDRIVCISEAERQAAIRKRVCSKSKTVLIENGVDILKIKNTNPLDKESIGLHASDYVVGMVGRITMQKGPDTFIRAARLISQNIPNAVFVIVGDGEDRAKIESYAKENNIKLHITGWVDNPYPYMKIFNVALVLSRWEGFGLVIPEFMAAGVNVIGTRVDAIASLIHDGLNGLLVNVDNAKEVSQKVIYLYSRPEEAKRIRTNATKDLSKFNIDRVADQHFQLFRKLRGK